MVVEINPVVVIMWVVNKNKETQTQRTKQNNKKQRAETDDKPTSPAQAGGEATIKNEEDPERGGILAA